MGFLYCPNCGQRVSDQAVITACPKDFHPFNANEWRKIREQRQAEKKAIQEQIKAEEEERRKRWEEREKARKEREEKRKRDEEKFEEPQKCAFIDQICEHCGCCADGYELLKY
jgi:Rieske Fe-S protein